MSSTANHETDLSLNLRDYVYPGRGAPKTVIKIESDDEIKTESDTDSESEVNIAMKSTAGEEGAAGESSSRFEGRKLRGRGFDLENMPSGEPLLRDMHIWPGCDSKIAPTPTMYANRHGGSRSTVTKRVNQALEDIFGEGASAAYRSMQKLPFPAVPDMRLATFDCAGAVDMMQRYGVAMALDMATSAKHWAYNATELAVKRYDVVIDGVAKEISLQTVIDTCAKVRGDQFKTEYEDYDEAFEPETKQPEGTLLDGSKLVFDFN